MALLRRRGRTLDCSTRVRTNLIMHRVVEKPTPESANGSKLQGRESLRFFEDAQSRHGALTKLAFSWKPFESDWIGALPTHPLKKRRSQGAYTPC